MLEVLSPAGDFECLRAAVDYGCDAVYIGGSAFGMRASPKNFEGETLRLAVEYAHQKNVKVYLTCNTIPTNDETEQFPQFIAFAQECGIDAAIVCDIGVLAMVKEFAPKLAIHISTQVGIVNYATANEFYKMGARRIVLAREVGIEEIKKIRARIPADMEIEAFVHGAMCVSFSGRCLLSKYLVNRDANRGECAQPCRWKYFIAEEKRRGQHFELDEDENGSYILNANDLCMIEHLDKLAEAGVSSFKIEGRAKSSYYVATVTNAYKAAVKAIEQGSPVPDWAKEEVYKVSHRRYCTGFYFDRNDAEQYYENSGYVRACDFIGTVDKTENNTLYITQRNYFTVDDDIEILAPDETKPIKLKIAKMFNEQGMETKIANHALEKLTILTDEAVVIPANSIMRKPEKVSEV